MKNEPMKVRIEFSTHESAFNIEGDVIRWGIGVQFFSNPTNLHMQVPCVILDCGGEIKVVNLQRDNYTISIERMK